MTTYEMEANFSVMDDDPTFYRAMRRNGMRLDPKRGWVDDIAERFERHMPQDAMPTQLQADIDAGMADILADLRNGTLTPLVEGTEADELEPVGWAERYG